MGIVVGTLHWTDPANDPTSSGILSDIQVLMHKYGLSKHGHLITTFGHQFSVSLGIQSILLHHHDKKRMYAFCNELQLKHPTVAFQCNMGRQ